MPDSFDFIWPIQLPTWQPSPQPEFEFKGPELPDEYWQLMWFELPEAGTIISDGPDLEGVGGYW